MPEEEEEKKEIKSEREKRKKEKSFAIFVVRKQEARTLYQAKAMFIYKSAAEIKSQKSVLF